jgi:crotonobetainyl-CoA:carnitine CoA-transferase CaiB-like acyl-CoA transferase
LLKEFNSQDDLEDERYQTEYRDSEEARQHLAILTDKMISRMLYDRDIWRRAQHHGLAWAPIRKPEENATDEHWLMRGAFVDVFHPELDETFVYVGARWVSKEVEWSRGPRPPLIGEHTDEVIKEWTTDGRSVLPNVPLVSAPIHTSIHKKPFALSGVRVVDLSWMLASAGAGRFLAAMGAEVIKVEHMSHPDRMRMSPLGACPPRGRAEREASLSALPTPSSDDPNRSGSFMEINAGKLGMSLNTKDPEGRRILEELIRDADMIVEGFSPGTMKRMGLSYDRLKEINPDIIYVQQSGLGEEGTYGRVRTFGPSAQAITGISDMSGLPEPFPPAGIGYSYLDWFGAYNMATAMLAALFRRNAIGEGCHIDSSQGETGLYLTGTAVLDHAVNGRTWSRYGNRSPYKPAAPHGIFRARGDDRWISIAVFTDEQWIQLTDVLGLSELALDPRFVRLDDRLAHLDELEILIDIVTQEWDAFDLMYVLQDRGVPSGVCQTAEDRCDSDPQLEYLEWLVELNQSEIGRWPVKEHPTKFSDTPTYMGGLRDRSGPSYGEDTDFVLREILKMEVSDIELLRKSQVI